MHIEETRRFTSTIAREAKMFQIELLIELLLGKFSAVQISILTHVHKIYNIK